MLYEGGNLVGKLRFPALKEAAHINDAARKAGDSPDFSRIIRQGRPRFEEVSSPTAEITAP
jgi:hypothetical protein